MSTFASPKYRSLVVKFANGERVKFHNGHADVEGDLAERLVDFAETHPDYAIEVTEHDRPETNKQRLQREARERGLDDSGTVAEIEARIAEHDADGDPDDADTEDGDDTEDDDTEE